MVKSLNHMLFTMLKESSLNPNWMNQSKLFLNTDVVVHDCDKQLCSLSVCNVEIFAIECDTTHFSECCFRQSGFVNNDNVFRNFWLWLSPSEINPSTSARIVSTIFGVSRRCRDIDRSRWISNSFDEQSREAYQQRVMVQCNHIVNCKIRMTERAINFTYFSSLI
jgi:hypothetical protein